jgi:predicted transcriptional regulator of viral defense system
MPHSRIDELVALAEDNDGLVTGGRARSAGFTDSVLARLVRRERIERIARGVYRIPYFPSGRLRWSCVSVNAPARQRTWISVWRVLARAGCNPYWSH